MATKEDKLSSKTDSTDSLLLEKSVHKENPLLKPTSEIVEHNPEKQSVNKNSESSTLNCELVKSFPENNEKVNFSLKKLSENKEIDLSLQKISQNKEIVDSPLQKISENNEEVNLPLQEVSESKEEINLPPQKISESKEDVNLPPQEISESKEGVDLPLQEISESKEKVNLPPQEISESKEKEVNLPLQEIFESKEKEVNLPLQEISESKEKEVNLALQEISESKEKVNLPLQEISESKEVNLPHQEISKGKEEVDLPLPKIFESKEVDLAHQEISENKEVDDLSLQKISVPHCDQASLEESNKSVSQKFKNHEVIDECFQYKKHSNSYIHTSLNITSGYSSPCNVEDNVAKNLFNANLPLCKEQFSLEKCLEVSSKKRSNIEIKATKELSETDICSSSLNCETDAFKGMSENDGLICSLSSSVVSNDCGVNKQGSFDIDEMVKKNETKDCVDMDHSSSSVKDEVLQSMYEQETNQNMQVTINSEEVDSENELRSFKNCEDNVSPSETGMIKDDVISVPKAPLINGDVPFSKRSSLKRKAEDEECYKNPKRKRAIQFDGVTVFYFPRSQGFTCVPSQGGSTLGMSRHHFHIRQFSLSEHAAEQRRAHKEYLLRIRQQKSNKGKRDLGSQCSSSEDSEENSEEASDVSDSELESDSLFFLQPLPIRHRRALLRQSGIRQIEGVEKEECKDIRISREMCGCQCKMYCHADTCQCALAGIKCQVDRHSFPCGCSRDGCGNPNGRIEFNPIRVRTHFLHTLMRLEIEKRQNVENGLVDNHSVQDNSLFMQSTGHGTSSSFSSLGRSLHFFNTTSAASVIPSAAHEISPCGNVGPIVPYSFERPEKENASCSFLDNRDYSPNNCNMFSPSLSSPFDSISSLTSFSECATPFHSQNSLSAASCYHSNSFSKFPSCSLSCSAAMAMLSNPFSVDSSCASTTHPLSSLPSSSSVNLTKLLPDDSSRFNINDFSLQDYTHSRMDENTLEKVPEPIFTKLFQGMEDADRSKKTIMESSPSASCGSVGSLPCFQETTPYQIANFGESHCKSVNNSRVNFDSPSSAVSSFNKEESCVTRTFGAISAIPAFVSEHVTPKVETQNEPLMHLDDNVDAKIGNQITSHNTNRSFNENKCESAPLATPYKNESVVDILSNSSCNASEDLAINNFQVSMQVNNDAIEDTSLACSEKQSDENSNTNSRCSVEMDCIPKCSSSSLDPPIVSNGASFLSEKITSDPSKPSSCLFNSGQFSPSQRMTNSQYSNDSSSSRSENDSSVLETVNA